MSDISLNLRYYFNDLYLAQIKVATSKFLSFIEFQNLKVLTPVQKVSKFNNVLCLHNQDIADL